MIESKTQASTPTSKLAPAKAERPRNVEQKGEQKEEQTKKNVGEGAKKS